MSEVLRLEKLSYGHAEGYPLFKDITLTLGRGEVIWLLGDTGSGKTILRQILIKELEPTSGSAFVFGRPLFGRGAIPLPALRRQIGLICHEPLLVPERSLAANVAFPLQISGWSRTKCSDRVTQALRRAGLLTKSRLPAGLLSTAEQRRLDLARVVAQSPPLIIAELNDCETDFEILVDGLDEMATSGSAVLILSRRKPKSSSRVVPAREMAIAQE